GGEKTPEEKLRELDSKFTVTGDKAVRTFGKSFQNFTYKLDPTTQPKAIDLFHRPTDSLAIYRLEGDTLQIAWHFTTSERPADFAATRGNAVFLLKRNRDPVVDSPKAKK